MGYTPVAGGAGATSSTSTPALSGTGGTTSFANTIIAVTPGKAATPTPRPALNDPDFAGVFPGATAPTTKSVGTLISELYKMSRAQIQDLQTQLTLAGYGKIDPTGMIDDATLTAYQGLLKDTAAYQAFDDRGLGNSFTPDSMLAQKVADANAAGGAATTGLSDPIVARQLVMNSMQSHLGRTPGPDEVAQFTNALRGYETANPTGSASAFADAYPATTQGMANEQGAQNEVGFVNVLSRLLGSA